MVLVVADQDQVEQVEQEIHLLYLLYKEIMVVLQAVDQTVVVAEAVQVQLVHLQERQPMVVEMEEMEHKQILQQAYYNILEVEEETLKVQDQEELVDQVVVELELEVQVIHLLVQGQVEQTKVVVEVE